ncbi:MAG TPA: tetratricopeptide repeat protein [Candidatus Binataceae bacterium]|nr:tetratricopeptide repeat protein [Candidatus Binataceae bacterium]
MRRSSRPTISSEPEASGATRAPAPWIAALLGAAAVAYVPGLRNEFVFDDYDMIVRNQFIGNWSFIWKSLFNDSWWFTDPYNLPASSYYRPLQEVWLALNYHLFGLNPLGWHAAMVALHVLVVWLVYRVASKLTADWQTGLLAAALFAFFPLHAEAVVWPSAIPLALSAAFELAAFDLYLSPSASRRAVSLMIFAGALLTHESAIAFPILIAAHAALFFDPSPGGRGQSSDRAISGSNMLGERAASTMPNRVRAAIGAMAPYAIEAGCYLALRFRVLGFITRANPLNHMTVREAVLTIPAAITSYATLLLTPWRVQFVYRLDPVESIATPGFLLPIAELAILSGAAFLFLRRAKRNRLHGFCIAWILIALIPALNLSGLFAQAVIQDRYLYLASFGLCVIAADLAIQWAHGDEWRTRAVWIAAALTAAGGLVALFFAQGLWHDEISLFSSCVDEVPQAAFCHDRLGMALMGRGEPLRARSELEVAKKFDPEEGTIRYDLGLVYENTGDRAAAAREISSGLGMLKHPPAAGYAKLALLYTAIGDEKSANAAVDAAATIPGGNAAADMTRAQIRLMHGDSKGAEDAVREQLKRDPEDSQALILLGTALSSQGRREEAIDAFQSAAKMSPPMPMFHYLIAFGMHRLGDDRDARDECALAIAGAPGNSEARALMDSIERSAAGR